MPNFDDLGPLAEQVAPQYNFAGSTPTDRLLSAFGLARKWMVPLIPTGYKLDINAAEATVDGYGRQIEDRKDIIRTALQTRTDLPETAALTTDFGGSRNYWLARYARAAAGMGAFVSGAAQQAALQGRVYSGGVFTQMEYEAQVNIRTREFAAIIDAGESGALPALVQPEAYAQQAASSSGQAAQVMESGRLPRSTAILVGSRGNTVRFPVRTGSGLSGGVAVPIVIGAVVAIVLLGVVAGFTIYYTQKERIRASSEFMTKLCSEAAASKDQKTLDACRRYAAELSEPQSLIQSLGGDKLQLYLALGAAALVGVYLLPTITQSFLSAQDVAAKHRAKSEV